jgi:chromosome segregation ATPase
MDTTTIVEIVAGVLGSGVIGVVIKLLISAGKKEQVDKENQVIIDAFPKAAADLRALIDTKASKTHERINEVISTVSTLSSEVSTIKEGLKERLRQLDKAELQVTTVVSSQLSQSNVVSRIEADLREVRAKADTLNREVGELKSMIDRK